MPKPKTVADFMAENDNDTIDRTKIQRHLAAMLKIGAEEYADERDFCTAARVSLQRITGFRNEFKRHLAYVSATSKRKAHFVWFANPAKVPVKFRYTPEKDDE